MSLRRIHLLPLSLLSLVVTASDTGIYTNSSSSSSSSSSSASATGCDKCTVTAFEQFYAYPYSIEVESITATNMVIPMVTIHPDGSKETNYVTETPKADPTAPYNSSPAPTDPFAAYTWVPVDNITLTYPTTYVQFFDLSGGTFFAVPDVPVPKCTFDDEPLDLPTPSATGLFVPLPSGVTVDLQHPTAISAPAAIHSYLNGIPAVSSQFDGTDVAKCQWTKVPKSQTSTHEIVSTEIATVQKVSVSVLTEVTADQVVITAPAVGTNTGTAAIAHVEDTGTILVAPAGNTGTAANSQQQNSAQAQQQGSQSTSTLGVGGAIAGIISPASSNSGSGSSGGSSGSSGGSSGSNSGSGSGTESGGQGSQSNGEGSSAPLPSPLVISLGGSQTTIAPTIIANPTGTGFVTAFILGSGSTLLAGGSTVISGSTVVAPSATTTGSTGDAIASGLGYTGPLSTGLASSIRGPNMPLWVLGAAASVLGALAVGL